MISAEQLHKDNLRTNENKNNNNTKNVFGDKDPCTQFLSFGEENSKEITGFIKDRTKATITWLFYVLTFGILRLVYHWYPHWKLLSTHNRCSLNKAQKVLIVDNYKDQYKTVHVENIKTLKINEKEEIRLSTLSIISTNGQIYLKGNTANYLTAHLNDGTTKYLHEIRAINFKKCTYVWDEDNYKFEKLVGLDRNVTKAKLHTSEGYSEEDQKSKRIIYGPNEIDVPVQSYSKLIVLEVMSPFYVFQVFSMIIWLSDSYYYYVPVIAIMSFLGIATTVMQTRKNQLNLKSTVHTSALVSVHRGNGISETIPSSDLVPGDVVEISEGSEMFCDAVLLNGNCVVNESMLTGESVPITKTALPKTETIYNMKEHSNHTLFCGTQVIQTRSLNKNKILAVVTRTGYLTTKGELVRSILYPPPADFQFDQDSYKFVWVLVIVAFIGFFYTIILKVHRQIVFVDVVVKGLDLFTIAIPPALPVAMTIGKLYAIHRLKKKQVYCINTKIMNVSGSLNCICFDKTGTLTEDGMDLWGILPVENGTVSTPLKYPKGLAKESALFKAMLTCHSLSVIDGVYCGDPLDAKMFESTGWELYLPEQYHIDFGCLVPTFVTEKSKSPESADSSIATLYQFPFISQLQRMSVITEDLLSHKLSVFCKGSPEMIMSLSDPVTVPSNIIEYLNEYTSNGYRVLAVAYKEIGDVDYNEIPKLEREQLERDLNFSGLIIFENTLKPETGKVLDTLKKACIRIVMVTGDNMQTAVSVAKECGMVEKTNSLYEIVCSVPNKYNVARVAYRVLHSSSGENVSGSGSLNGRDIELFLKKSYHLAISGTSWQNLNSFFPELVPKVTAKGVVFARMSGLQKRELIEELQTLGYSVGMCGDGANDCSALKTANVGISLSEAEASVASPFTSKRPNITCVLEVIKEGRAALVTSFGLFKMMICSSLTEFLAVIVLYLINSNLTNFEFLYLDMGLILPFLTFFGNCAAADEIYHEPPLSSMWSFLPIVSLILFLFCTVLFQVVSFIHIQTYSWFVPFHLNERNAFMSYENYAVFSMAVFQYVTMAIVFSKGSPYRKQIYTNKFLVLFLILGASLSALLVMYVPEDLATFIELKLPPTYTARLAVLGLAFLNLLVCLIMEKVFVDFILREKIYPKFEKFKKPLPYVSVLTEIDKNFWPVGVKCDTTNNSVIVENANEIDNTRNGTVNKSFEIDNDNSIISSLE